ncbi:ABC transporter permease [Nitritalea halalkaliphila]|uniref:ABC transporter permease n=1 Tax=Nitritalea halalkaliphila TaxID=590849 RepID=UPI002934C172|nr:FtsX-like permease family protein [Nitritalea halalkaliphila]
MRENDQAWESERIRATTVSESQNRTGRAFDNLAGFLSLVAFIALLLGCVGVGSAVNVFIKEKLASVAVLRCLGVSARVATLIYLVQILLMGTVGALLGSTLGTALQLALPYVLGDFLPVEVSFGISWSAIGLGMLTGIVVSVLFALLPLLKIRRVSPMATLRPEMQEAFGQDPLRYLVVLAILAFVYGFSYFLLANFLVAIGFTAFVCGAFLLLWGLATLLMKSIRRFLPLSLPYTLRQALANLYRPNNQTVALIATVGLGTAMISTLIFVQSQLLEEVKFADRGDQPNMLLFDIQTHQVEAVRAKLEQKDLPILQQVPIVTMGLEAINGISRKQNDTLPEEERRSRSLYNREFRVTYRDTLIASERLTAGKLRPYASGSDSIFVSVDESYARRTGLELGDRLDFNVQGRPLRTYVGSLREVKFNQVSTNFLVLFPEGVLTNAPKFHVLITKTKDEFEAAAVQAEVSAPIRIFPW